MTIGIVCTARAFSFELLESFLQQLQNWGIAFVVGKSIGVANNQFAGTDDLRAADLENMLKNKAVDMVLCAKGGYGTARILDLIDWQNCPQKPILGFSDITALHSHLHNLGWKTAHTPMCSVWNNICSQSQASFYDYLQGKRQNFVFQGHVLNTSGTATAPVIGGNLSVLYSLMGSNSEMDFAGKILFLEDLDEYLYHIDRMMLCLKRAGKLAKLAGMVVGGFTDMKDNDILFGASAYQIIKSHLESYNYPVAFGFPCGHQPQNYTLRLGETAHLQVIDKKNSWLNFENQV